ncbi:MAG: Zn-ribbon domain-containing OB-fold protein [Thermoprotei archaeon]
MSNPLIKPDEKEGHPVYVSQRELRLRYEIPVGEVYTFFKGLEEGKVLASKCSTCGQLYFPPQGACPKCRGDKMEWVDLNGEAELLAYTQIFVRPQSFSAEQPYFVGVAKCKEGVNVLARIANVNDPKKIRIGMRLKLKVERAPNGVPTYILEA